MRTQTVSIKKANLETELERYEALNTQIKTMEAEKERLRQALVKSYFESKAVYQSQNILATYMPQDRTLFNNKEFKETHPNLYDEFSYQQTVHIFCVKVLK